MGIRSTNITSRKMKLQTEKEYSISGNKMTEGVDEIDKMRQHPSILISLPWWRGLLLPHQAVAERPNGLLQEPAFA